MKAKEPSSTAVSSRRDFVVGAGALAAGLSLASISGAQNTALAAQQDYSDQPYGEPMSDEAVAESDTIIEKDPVDTGDDNTYIPHLGELATPVIPAPETTSYECDVLVVGGGLAALNAAVYAAEQGKSVVLADKGTPGYSGLSAWPSCDAYFDPDYDADQEPLWDKYMVFNGEGLCNLDWEDVWCKESKETYQRLVDWGWIKIYDNGKDAGYWVDGKYMHDDPKGYLNNYLRPEGRDRHLVFMDLLNEKGVTVLDHTMVVDIIESDAGACVGAVGVQFQSGTPITFSAKAVILCTGNGTLKGHGFPVGANTFDGLCIGYRHGLPITGLEFEDYHTTNSFGAGCSLFYQGWGYLESVWPTGSTVTESSYAPRAKLNTNISQFYDGCTAPDTTNLSSDPGAACSIAYKNGDTSDPRAGKYTSPMVHPDRPGAATGMPSHLCSGIWCGLDETHGATAIPGLYVAGDGTNATYSGGPNYTSMRGSTSNFVSLMGWRASTAACEYIEGMDQPVLPEDKVQEVTDSIMAPYHREKGYDPTWALDMLDAIMSPAWVTIAKDEEGLEATLTQVKRLDQMTSGKLRANNPHELRICQEVPNQILAMELKLRASIDRKESRGYHFRTDYQFKTDEFQCYLTYTKGDDGEPVMSKVELKDRWKGDTTLPYWERYPLEFPEEIVEYGSNVDSDVDLPSEFSR